MGDPIADTGALALGGWRDLQGAVRLFVGVLARLLTRPLAGGAAVRDEVVRQIYFTGVEGLLATTLIAFLVGGITAGQLLAFVNGPQAQSWLGTALRVGVVRELGPLLAATVVVARSASAIAVDLGNLSLRGEIAALEAMGIDPVRFLALPRIVGVAVSTAALCVVFDVFAMAGAVAVAREFGGLAVGDTVFGLAQALSPFDLALGVEKGLVFGAVIGAVATQEGLGGGLRSVADIPRRTGRAVIATLLVCLLVDAVEGVWLFEVGL